MLSDALLIATLMGSLGSWCGDPFQITDPNAAKSVALCRLEVRECLFGEDMKGTPSEDRIRECMTIHNGVK